MNEYRCFFCEEVFTDRQLAAEHFGAIADTDPICVTQRDKSVMELVVELNYVLRQNRRMSENIEILEHVESSVHYNCRKITGLPHATMSDVAQRTDALEGRLLAAEARLKAVRESVVTKNLVQLIGLVEYKIDVPDLTLEEKRQCLST